MFYFIFTIYFMACSVEKDSKAFYAYPFLVKAES